MSCAVSGTAVGVVVVILFLWLWLSCLALLNKSPRQQVGSVSVEKHCHVPPVDFVNVWSGISLIV